MVAARKPIIVPLTQEQSEFILSEKLVKGFTGGRGASKSVAGSINLGLRSLPGGSYMVVSPNYGMLMKTLRTFIRFSSAMGLWDDKRFWAGKPPRAILRNNAEVDFRSGDDPGSLKGGDYAGVWLDEMQESDEEVFRNVEPSLRQWGRRGWLAGTFTPGPPDHWTSKVFINPVNPEDVFCKRASTKSNVFQELAIYEAVLRSWAASPLRIRRELEGECVYLEGAEWLPEYFDNTDFDEWPMADVGGTRVLSLDPSKGRGEKTSDYSAFVMLWFVPGKVPVIYLDADMRNDRGDIEIAETAVQIWKEFRPHYFALENESHQQDHLIRDIHRIADREGLPIAITPMTSEGIPKQARCRRLSGYVSERWFRYRRNSPGAKLLKEQMMAFPLGHDDGPDALAQGIKLLRKEELGQIRAPSVYGITPMGDIYTPHSLAREAA